MIIHDPTRRRAASTLARCGVVFSVIGLGISAWNMSFSGVPSAAAATNEGAIQVITPLGSSGGGSPLSGGGSGTAFGLALPVGAACDEDSAAGDWRTTSFMVPAGTDLATLTFDPSGPSPADYGTYATFRMPLWEVGGNPYVSRSTVNATPPDPTGPVLPPTSIDFGVYGPGDVPAGAYEIGIACTDETTTIQQFWTTSITVTADDGDAPAGITWAVVEGGGGTTTTTTTGGGDTTTTTEPDTTTTTTGGDTTTTTTGGDGTTTTTGEADVSGGSFSGGTPSAASPVTTAGQLPYTGSSPIPMVVWAVALVVFGRVAMLLGKRPKVVGDDPTG